MPGLGQLPWSPGSTAMRMCRRRKRNGALFGRCLSDIGALSCRRRPTAGTASGTWIFGLTGLAATEGRHEYAFSRIGHEFLRGRENETESLSAQLEPTRCGTLLIFLMRCPVASPIQDPDPRPISSAWWCYHAATRVLAPRSPRGQHTASSTGKLSAPQSQAYG